MGRNKHQKLSVHAARTEEVSTYMGRSMMTEVKLALQQTDFSRFWQGWVKKQKCLNEQHNIQKDYEKYDTHAGCHSSVHKYILKSVK